MEFLKYLLSEVVQSEIAEDAAKSKLGSSGFPVGKEALEQFFVYLQQDDKVQDDFNSVGEFSYLPAPLSDEDIGRLRDVFMTARPVGTKSQALQNFVEEEMGSYISGEKSAQEVLDILQNRTQLYMDEMN